MHVGMDVVKIFTAELTMSEARDIADVLESIDAKNGYTNRQMETAEKFAKALDSAIAKSGGGQF